ncbi:hypothetical protein SXCC_01865 [Gluconacetobacter sp. SXCC-1]|nr:hypothetical protein SXCC_01865 [Gluconacetobacter sp. SXCC-1]
MTITHSPQTGEFSTSTFGEITTSTHTWERTHENTPVLANRGVRAASAG